MKTKLRKCSTSKYFTILSFCKNKFLNPTVFKIPTGISKNFHPNKMTAILVSVSNLLQIISF